MTFLVKLLKFAYGSFVATLLSLASLILLVKSAPASGSSIVTTEKVTVFGTRVSADEVDIAEQTAFITVISKEEIASRFGTAGDVLASQSSIQVRDSGGIGAFSTLYLRGSSTQQVNVYLDGVLLNNVVSGTVDLGRISLNQIDSIEIYRGAPPVQFVHSAIGGAVNIRTGSLTGENRADLTLGFGSFNTQKANLSGLYSLTPRLSIQGAVGYQASDNDFEFVNDNQTPLNPYDDRTEHRNNNDVEMLSGLVSGRYQVSDSESVLLRIQRHEKKHNIADLFNSVDTASALDSDLTQVQLYLNQDDWQQGAYTIGAFYGRVEEHFIDRQGRVGIGRQDETSLTETFGGELTGLQLVGDLQVSASVELKWDGYKNQQKIGDSPDQEFERYSAMFASQSDYAFADGLAIWQAGVRVQGIRDDGQQPGDNGLEDVSDSKRYFSWHTGLRWDFSPWATLKGNLSRGIRIPRLSEKFGDRGLFIGNPELREEEAINLDLGVTMASGDFELTMALFLRWLDDAIVAAWDSRGVGRFENISRAEIQGVEFDATYSPLEWLTLVGRTTVQNTENTSHISDQRGNRLAGHYDHAHYLSGTLDYADWLLTTEFEYQVGGYYDSAEAAAIPDKTRVNLLVQWQPGDLPGSLFSFEARNITDESFEAFNGYPAPGRHYLVAYNQFF